MMNSARKIFYTFATFKSFIFPSHLPSNFTNLKPYQTCLTNYVSWQFLYKNLELPLLLETEINPVHALPILMHTSVQFASCESTIDPATLTMTTTNRKTRRGHVTIRQRRRRQRLQRNGKEKCHFRRLNTFKHRHCGPLGMA